MLGWLVRRRIAAFERAFDYDMSYARDIYDASPRAFFRFSKILGISSFREDAPKEAWYAAKLAATSIRVALAGNAYDGVGVPASIGSGRRAARETLNSLKP